METLVRAIRARDVDLYKKCFTEEAQKGEAALGELKENSERFWTRLQGLFRGPQTLRVPAPGPDDRRIRGHVVAPEAEEGGIGSITFEKEGADWKVCRW